VLSVISVDNDDAPIGATTNNLLAPAKFCSNNTGGIAGTDADEI
jgi:hypothetical protein